MRFLILSIFCLSMPLLAHAKDEKNRFVTVTGNCIRSVAANRASITATVVMTEPLLKKSTQEAQKRYEQFRDAVKKLNLNNFEMETAEYSVNEHKEWEKDKQVFKGYQTRIALKMESSEIQRFGEVVELASQLDVREVTRLNLFVSNEKMKEESEACLETAVKNAKEKAKKMAAAIGSSVGDPISIEEAGAPSPHSPQSTRSFDGAMLKSEMSSAAPTIEAGNTKIQIAVQASFFLN